MADQVNPMGSLATGAPQMLVTATKSQATPEPRPAKTTDSQTKRPVGQNLHQQTAKATDADLKAINDGLQQSNSNLEFQVDKTTGTPVFKIVNSTTGEIIRQVPSEEVLTMARKLRELSNHENASGVLVDKEG